MFRRKAPQALALGSASFGVSGHVLRTETLGLKRNLHFTSTPAKTSFVQPASRGWAAKRSNFRESKLHFSSQSRPSESRASLPLAIAIACTGTAAALFVTNAWQKVHAEGEPQSNEEEGFFSGLYKKVTGSVSEAFNSSNDSLLLPDPDPAPYTKKYTVVIADDALLARSYSLREGFATKKRPGVEYFLATLAALDYEVVLWSLQGVQVFGQMMEKVDPNHHAPHRLFLDATVLSSTGKQLKDLGRLNRHLSKVIAVDVDREGVTPQENLVIVPKYTGKEPKDTTLIDMIPFFKLIAHGKHGGDLRVWAKDWNEKGPKHFQDLYADAVRKYQQRRDEEQQQRGNRRSDQEEDDTAGPSRSFWRR